MAYPNYFPQTYQNTYYPQTPTYTAPAPSTSSNEGINWVQGEVAARAYHVDPGKSTLLMDSESDVFYIKSSDMSGMPLPLRIFDYKERQLGNQPMAQISQENTPFVTKEELNERLKELEQTLTSKKKEKSNEQFVI